MTSKFVPEDTTGRLIAICAMSCEPIASAATVMINVLNQTGKTIRLIGASAFCTACEVAGTLVDVQNATGTMITGGAAIPIVTAGTAAAGAPLTTNDTVASAGIITFLFTDGPNVGAINMDDAQCVAYFTVVA